MFQRLRSRHQIDAATMAGWYSDLPNDRRGPALRYLLHGRLQQEVLQRLVALEDRPSWLRDFDGVRRLLDELGAADWLCQRLLASLFPGRFRQEDEPEVPTRNREQFFERLLEWWNDDAQRRPVLAAYETRAWPEWLRAGGLAEGLLADSQDHWLGLLVLGACRSLGRKQSSHHRSFLDAARSRGWWEILADPDRPAPWMGMLREWQDKSVSDLHYRQWMSLFPSIYQLSRYLPIYRRLLKGAGRRPPAAFKIEELLSPRADPALTGAGRHFDAPPAPLGIGLHWILRELVRLGVIDGDHLLPACFVPGEQVLHFLRPLGMEPLDGTSNAHKAREVSRFLAEQLGTPLPHLHRSFDIPLHSVNELPELRSRPCLET